MAERARSTPLRVGLVGAGTISANHLTAWSRCADAGVVAVCDLDRGRAEARAKAFGIPAVHDDLGRMVAAERLDAVDIATTVETHPTLVLAAAERGVDILCQKPLAPSLAAAEALIAQVGDRVRLMAHQNWRFRPYYRQIGQWLREGRIGAIRQVHMALCRGSLVPDAGGRRPQLERQPFMKASRRLVIAESLIHHLDVVRWLAGPLRLIGARALWTVDEMPGETTATIFLETAAGAPVVVEGNMDAPGFPPRAGDTLRLVGSVASVLFEEARLHLAGPRPQTITYDEGEAYQAAFDNCIAHFVACLREGRTFETNPADNLETLRLVEAAYAAAGLDTRRSGPR